MLFVFVHDDGHMNVKLVFPGGLEIRKYGMEILVMILK